MDFRIAASSVIVAFSLSACGGGGGGGGGNSSSGGTPPPPAITVTVNAGTDQQSVEGTTVQLSGSGSASNGGSVSYSWSQVRGPSVSLSSTSATNPTFTAPDVVVGYPQELEFRLTVNGPQSSTGNDTVIVEVGPQESIYFRAADSGSTAGAALYRYDLFPPAQVRLSSDTVSGGSVKSFFLSPDGEYVAYVADAEVEDQLELYLVPAGGGSAVKINPTLASGGSVFDVSWSPDSARILFKAAVFASNVRDLYVHDVAANETTVVNAEQITVNGGSVGSEQWSPDGQLISYTDVDFTQTVVAGISIHDVNQPTAPDVRITDQPELATSTSVGEHHWRPDSSGVVFGARPVGGQPFQLFSVDNDGSDLLNLGVPGASRIAVSPDGAYVSTIADHDQDGEHSIFIVEADGTPSARIATTDEANHNIGTMTWAPDGHRLAFYERVPNGVQRGLYTVLPDGSDRARITMDAAGDGLVFNFGWSPDSTAIAFRERPVGNFPIEIWVADPDGGNVLRVSRDTTDTGRLTEMADGPKTWSPDSQRIAYRGEYDDDGLMGMYTAGRNGGSRRLMSIKPLSFRGDVRAGHSWSTNNEGIAFVSAQETSQTYDLFYTSENSAVTGNASVDLVSPGQVFDDFAWGPSP